MPRSAVWLLAAVLALVACTDDAPTDDGAVSGGQAGDADTDTGDMAADAEPGEEPAADEGGSAACRHDALEDDELVALTDTDAVTVSAEVAARTHGCAPLAVVAPTGGWEALLAAAVARLNDAPLLLVDPAAPTASDAMDALDALEVEEVIAVGVPLDALDRTGTELVVPDQAAGTEEPAGTDDTEEIEGADDAGTEETVDPDEAQGTDGSARTAEGATTDATGDPDAAAADPVEVERLGRLAREVAEHLGTDRFLAVRYDDAHAALAAAHLTDGSMALLPVPEDPTALAELATTLPANAELVALSSDDDTAFAEDLRAAGFDVTAGDELWTDAGSATAWLADPAAADVAAVAAVAAGARDEAVLPVDGSDLRAGDDARRLRERAPQRVVLVGDVTEDADWQVETVLTGPTLPGGGHRLFENERMVAIYGHPGSTVLGALGEQDLDGAVERVREVSAPYGADGAEVLPTFEIITTIASAEAGPRGDYSRRSDPELLRPWIDRAAEEGFYVVLDLQPGRTDFLEQAQEYEEFLREPHVGLALDPEWRLEPDQVHLRQIGSVEAEEVQRVADWLADLTRENRLPQKALVLHQFRLAMLPDRDTIVAPPELAVVIHMDGQGAIEDKYATYELITTGAEDRWVWGWKNFYDEDFPTPTPAEVLAVDPLPWFVTYQ